MAEELKSAETLKEAEKSEDIVAATKRIKAKDDELNARALDLEKREKDLQNFVNVTALGGKSTAGQERKPIEETPKEYAARILRGGK